MNPQDPTAQAVYQSQPVSSDEVYANHMQSDRVKNIISQISPENQIEEIEMRIRGYRKDPTTGLWEKIGGVKEPSKELVGNYTSFLASIMNQNTTMGNLSTVQVNKIMNRIIEYLADDLDENAEKYGLEDNYSERTRIGNIILNNTFMVLTRSINGIESRRIWNSLSLVETSNPMQQQSKNEWWKFWK